MGGRLVPAEPELEDLAPRFTDWGESCALQTGCGPLRIDVTAIWEFVVPLTELFTSRPFVRRRPAATGVGNPSTQIEPGAAARLDHAVAKVHETLGKLTDTPEDLQNKHSPVSH
jgi:hypothetical protein